MVRNKDVFKIGDKIDLIKINSKEERAYPSQILDIIDGGIFLISGPIYRRQLIIVRKDEDIRISFIVKNKGKYVFDARVLDREYTNIYKLKVERISDIKIYQQREFYRFDTSIPVTKFFSLDNNGEEEILIEKCRTKDISGSGLKLYTNYKHQIGDIISCKFRIGNHPINTKGKILRVENIDTFEYKYSLGIHMFEIDEEDRDKIIKFIFSQQQLLRRKGLI